MLSDDSRKELANILRGDVIERHNCYLTAARNYLSKSFGTSKAVEKNFEQQSPIKEKQKEYLIIFIEQNQLWINDFAQRNYLTEGGEAKVYFNKTAQCVVKLNDAIYYNTWLDYLNSILIHNLFFQRTRYTLIGFLLKETTLFCGIRTTIYSFRSTNRPVRSKNIFVIQWLREYKKG